MKTYLKTTLIGAASLAMASTASAKDLVMAYSGSLKDPAMVCGIQTVANELAAMVGAEVEMHVGGTGFAAPKKLYSQLARGVTDISVMPLAYTPGRFPMSEIIGLPFVAKNNYSATTAANTLLDEYLSEEFADTIPLAVMAIPNYQIHLKDPVEDLTTGLQGLRIRATGKVLSDTLRGLGADVVGMPIFQVYENMQKGVMDGYVLPNVPLAAFKLHEVSDYHIQVDIAVPVLYMGLSKKFYDGLSDEQRATVDEKYRGVDAALGYVGCFEKLNKVSMGLAAKDGGVVRSATDAENAAMMAIVDPIVTGYIASLEERGLAGQAFYDAFKAEVAAADATN